MITFQALESFWLWYVRIIVLEWYICCCGGYMYVCSRAPRDRGTLGPTHWHLARITPSTMYWPGLQLLSFQVALPTRHMLIDCSFISYNIHSRQTFSSQTAKYNGMILKQYNQSLTHLYDFILHALSSFLNIIQHIITYPVTLLWWLVRDRHTVFSVSFNSTTVYLQRVQRYYSSTRHKDLSSTNSLKLAAT